MTRRRGPKTTLQGTPRRGGPVCILRPCRLPAEASTVGGSHQRWVPTPWSCCVPAFLPTNRAVGLSFVPPHMLNPPHTEPTACAQQMALPRLTHSLWREPARSRWREMEERPHRQAGRHPPPRPHPRCPEVTQRKRRPSWMHFKTCCAAFQTSPAASETWEPVVAGCSQEPRSMTWP